MLPRFYGDGLLVALGVHVRPARLGNRHPFMYPFDTFNWKDKMICVDNDHLYGILCGVLNLTALPADTRFKTNGLRRDNHDALKSAMELL